MLTGLSQALPGALLGNATHRLGDRQCVILCQTVRGSVRAIRAIRNTRVFQMETSVVGDAYCHRAAPNATEPHLNMTRVVHLHDNLLQSYSRNLWKKQNTLILKTNMPPRCLSIIQKRLLLTASFVLFSSSPLAAQPFFFYTAPPFLFLLPYSSLAPMYYPSHPNLPISVRIPN